MGLANYTQLTAAIVDWLDDADKAAFVPDFVALAEAEFNRVLRAPDMEARATATLTGEALAVPADFKGVKSITADGAAFDVLSPDDLFAIPASQVGTPRNVAIVDGQFFFRPVPTTGTIQITYYQSIPALVTVGTNWLLTKHPDLYLFASLTQAEFFGWNDSRLPLIKSRADEIMMQISEAGNRERFGGRVIRRNNVTSGSTRQVRA